MKLIKYLLYLSIFSIIIGPLGKIPLGIPNISLYISDIILALLWVVYLTNSSRESPFGRLRGSTRNIDKISQSFFIFVLVAFLSLIFTPISLSSTQWIISSLYLLRLVAYFGFYFIVKLLIKNKSKKKKEIVRCLMFSGVILAVVGWVQYFLYPDLRNLYYLGWDPHYKRIFATYFDPNFLGLIFVFTLIILFSFKEKTDRLISLFIKIFIFLSLMFTYSRSSYFAVMTVTLLAALIKKRVKIIILVFLILSTSMLFLPRPSGEGVKLERLFSIRERLESWQQGIRIFSQHPILGVGFNTLRYAKIKYYPTEQDLEVSHSGAGIENSFIFIAATSGIVGLIAYLYFLYQVFIRGKTHLKLTIIAAVTHGFFLNSLFFPWIVIWLWIVIAVYSS